MLRRLFVGLVLGLIVGVLTAAGLVGMNRPQFEGAFLAYAAAAVTGVLTGLVAGKPIWAQGGKVEAALKAVFGALLAAGGMFALRTWVQVQVPLDMLGAAGTGKIGELPAASLPALGAALAMFLELDNTGEAEPSAAKAPAVEARKKGANGKARVATEGRAEEEEEVRPKRAKH
ncbi:MAG: hypothetical protein WCI05_03855 [Myxococcales bacterium]